MNTLIIEQQQNYCKIAGAVSFATVMEVRAKGFDLIQQYSEIKFNFAEVTNCDSSAVALLLNLTRHAAQLQKKITFIDLPQQLLDIADLCGVLSFLNFTASSTKV